MSLSKKVNRQPLNRAVSTLGLQRKLAESESIRKAALNVLAALAIKTDTFELSAADVAVAGGKRITFTGDGHTVKISVSEVSTHAN